MTDTSYTKGSGVVLQGNDWLKSDVVASWSGKYNSAQQNYPVHEQELLAIVETLKRFKHLLQSVHFQIFYKPQRFALDTNAEDTVPGQAQWLEKISDFDFKIIHVPGVGDQ